MIIKFNSNNLNKNKYSYFKNKMDILTFNKKNPSKKFVISQFRTRGLPQQKSLLFKRFELYSGEFLKRVGTVRSKSRNKNFD